MSPSTSLGSWRLRCSPRCLAQRRDHALYKRGVVVFFPADIGIAKSHAFHRCLLSPRWPFRFLFTSTLIVSQGFWMQGGAGPSTNDEARIPQHCARGAKVGGVGGFARRHDEERRQAHRKKKKQTRKLPTSADLRAHIFPKLKLQQADMKCSSFSDIMVMHQELKPGITLISEWQTMSPPLAATHSAKRCHTFSCRPDATLNPKPCRP